MPASRGPSQPNSRNGACSGPTQLPASPTTPKSPRSPTSPPVKQMQSLCVSLKPPGQSGPGQGGEVLKILSNHFVVNPSDMPPEIYKWNIEIRLANPGQNRGPVVGRIKRRVVELFLQIPPYNIGVYSDFEQALWSFKTLTPAQNVAQSITVDYYEKEESGPRTGAQQVLYIIQITLAFPPLPTQPLKDLLANPGPGTAIQRPLKDYEDALNNMVLRYAALNDHLTTAQRGTRIFPKTPMSPAVSAPPKRKELGGGLTAYRGYSRRVRFVTGGIMLALSSTAGVMYDEGAASKLISNWLRAHPNEPQGMLNQFLSGVRVQGMFGVKRVKPITSVLARSAQATTFHCDAHPRTHAPINRKVDVVWYFKETYNIDISPNGRVLNVGSAQRPVFWPADLCHVLPAQTYKQILPLSSQAQHMIKFACRKPQENESLILTEGHEMVGITKRQGEKFGTMTGTPIKVLIDLATLLARRIPSPSLLLANGTITGRDTAKGQWNLQGRKFLGSPTTTTKFTVLVLRRPKESGIINLQAFKDALQSGMKSYCGIDETCISVPNVPDAIDWPVQGQIERLKSLFTHCGKISGVCYCFVITSDRSWYTIIKEAADSVGMQTTVTLRNADNTVKASPGFIANLMLKYSMKTLGRNWALAQQDFGKILKEDTMLMALDVVHPPPGAMKGAPSVAGLVYSVNPVPGQFLPYINLLIPETGKAAREVVPTGSLRPMVEYALLQWKKSNNGNLPRRIFMCRDVVSEMQLTQVLETELPALKKAAINTYEGRQTPQVFILNTQKRHITRFFKATDDKKSSAWDPNGKPLPGLIVDQKIVSRAYDDWYAVSHKCLQGTTRPAHLVRLWDELKLSKSELQQMVHNLSFLSPRSTTSLSIPAPVMMADLLCERAKTRLHPVYFPSEEDKLRGTTWSIHGPWFKGQGDVHERIRDTMYYI